jgi:hypothetical protein
MIQDVVIENNLDSDGNPAGGVAVGNGLLVRWQNGPLGRGEERQEPNGAFVEDVLSVVLARLRFYQETKFACHENAEAIHYVEQAITMLQRRTAARESRGVEGTLER